MEKSKYYLIIILAILIGIFGLYFLNISDKPRTDSKNINTIKIDTIIKFIYQEPIVITKYKTRLVKKSDTIIEVNPFVALIDTFIKHDTIRAEFEFPQNLFSMEIKRKPDSVRIEKITQVQTIEKDKPWWEVPVYIVGGTVLGYLLGSSFRK
jgi:hypothetical protein